MRRSRLALAAAAPLLLAACGSPPAPADAPERPAPTPPAAAPAPAPATSPTITIAEFAYGPELTVPPGALVTVVNSDEAPHNVAAIDGTFDSAILNRAGWGPSGRHSSPAGTRSPARSTRACAAPWSSAADEATRPRDQRHFPALLTHPWAP